MMSPKPTRLPAPPTAIRSMSAPSAAIAIPILSILPNIPWIVNETAEKEEDRTDADGWKVVKAANCLEAGRLERECARCGETEDKVGDKATGHKWNNATVDAKTKNQCAIDTTLVDAEGNAIYAYECENENCPVNVTIDKAGNTAHYIKATEHKLKTVHEVNYCVDEETNEKVEAMQDGSYLGEGEGHRYEICENCSTYGSDYDPAVNKDTELEPVGHKWNTVQIKSGDPVVVCEADPDLTKDNYIAAMKAALGTQGYAAVATKLNQYFDSSEGVAYSRYCSVCGALQIAGGHEYVVSPLEEGKYDLNDYEKNEDGTPVVAEDVTVADMDCRYVQVCKNEGCGKVLGRGAHGDVTEATCRKGGFCEICGEQFTAQLTHKWKSVAEIIKEGKDAVSGDAKKLYDAYVKVSATETWMTPLEGSCDEKSTAVTVCTECLLAAANGTDVTWNQATSMVDGKPSEVATATNAYVVTNDFGHDYQPVYFRMSDGAEIPYTQTTCAVGFYVKYVCDKCGDVFTNVPVANDPNTKPEGADEDKDGETNEARFNEAKPANATSGNIFTDNDGFVIVTENVSAGVDFEAEDLAKALAAKEDHKGIHLIALAEDYNERNGYEASTCVSTAVIPVVCANCGATLSYTWTQIQDSAQYENDLTKTIYDFTIDRDALDGKTFGSLLDEADKKVNYLNHAGKAFECGLHCDAHEVVNGQTVYTCSGFDADHSDKVSLTATDFNAKKHDTVTISYKLTVSSNYYSDYSIKIATFATAPEAGKVDWTKATFTDTTKISVCAGDDEKVYNLPAALETATATPKANTAYIVLVSADGKEVYPMIGTIGTNGTAYTLYTEDKTSDTTEGTVGNVVADKSVVSQDDTFFLEVGDNALAPVTAVDAASLELALKKAQVSDKGVMSVKLAADATVALTSENIASVLKAINDKITAGAKDVTIDLNGGALTWNGKEGVTFSKDAKITFANGDINFTEMESGTTAITVADKADVVFDKVALNTENANAVVVNYATNAADQGTFTAKDSTITSYGNVGVSIDAPSAAAVEKYVTAVTLTNTNIVMTKAADVKTYVMSTAMVVGAPVNVVIKNGEFSANQQALVVRGGDVDVTSTTFTLNASADNRVVYATGGTVGTDKTKAYVEFSDLFTNVSAASDDWDEFIPGVTDVQTYRMAGLWGNGAEVARAAVVVGNNNTANDTNAAYKFVADLRLQGVSFKVAENDETLVVGLAYNSSVYTTKVEGEDVDVDVVTIDARNSGLSADVISYTYNCYVDGVFQYEDNLNLVGFIAVAE